MEVTPFFARDAADAVAQIRSRLGSRAVVLNVRRVPGTGLSGLLRRARLEVLAGVPDGSADSPAASAPAPTSAPEASPLFGASEPWLKPDVFDPSPAWEAHGRGAGNDLLAANLAAPNGRTNGAAAAWPTHGRRRSAALLERLGLLPVCLEQVLERLEGAATNPGRESLAADLALTRHALESFWRQPSPAPVPSAAAAHVFVGPAGTGKTTVLCKWLAQSVLTRGRTGRIFRLDGRSANTAQSLSLYAEILGVPVERRWRPGAAPAADCDWFIDLPGVELQDADAMRHLEQSVRDLPGVSVHLVLNAAYSTPLLLAQARAFASLPVRDLIFTHLDEETEWGKLWNFVVGTNYTILSLSAGQNIPGTFVPANPRQLLPPQFCS